MQIDILVGDNPYGTVFHFSKGLASALERAGVRVRLFWIGEDQFFHAFYAILADPPDLTCSFSDISLQGRPLGDLWAIPHLSMCVDPPIYFLHQMQGPLSWISCVDEKDCAFLGQFPRTFFLPHAADAALLTPINTERPLQQVFFGTCIDYEAIASSLQPSERELLFEAANKVLSPDDVSIAESLLSLGFKESHFFHMHGLVDSYIRGKDRVELLRRFPQAHVWGSGPWKKYLPNHRVHPPQPFEKTLEIMRQSQVVLNSSPRFKAGAHERLFYALMCGASVYTGANPFLSEHVPCIETYQFGAWASSSFKEWQERASQGQKIVLEKHTWDIRARTIIQQMEHWGL